MLGKSGKASPSLDALKGNEENYNVAKS